MAQYYTVTEVSSKPPTTWEGRYGQMETYKVKLEGVDEPVEVNRKPGNVPKPAEALYGEIKSTEYGYKFSPEKKPWNGLSGGGQKYTRDDSAIRAQWAIGQSVVLYNANNEDSLGPHMNVIEAQAKELYAMVDRVKGETPVKTLETPQTGYDKAKQVRKQLDYDASDDPEFASMMAKGLEADDIKLDDIPF